MLLRRNTQTVAVLRTWEGDDACAHSQDHGWVNLAVREGHAVRLLLAVKGRHRHRTRQSHRHNVSAWQQVHDM
jgi:hypothetical protein